jgi:chromosome partitioning protein
MDGKPAGMTANVPHGTIEFSRKEELCVAKIVAIANQKGGVGKTTTAVNLSSCVAALGKRVLIVDLDPQGNTTTGYGIPKRSVEKGTYEILIGEARASEAIRKTEYRTDVIGSNTRLAGASLEMIDLPARESRLRKALAEVQKDYDFIFIDCPPSLDLLTLNGLSACDSVLIPVQCEYYALEGLSELISTLKTIRKKYNPYLDIEGVVFTMFSLRYNLTVQVVEQVQKYFGSKVYKTTIPRSIRISEAPSYGQPINFYEPKGKGSEAYMDLAIEFVKNNRPHEPKKARRKSAPVAEQTKNALED